MAFQPFFDLLGTTVKPGVSSKCLSIFFISFFTQQLQICSFSFCLWSCCPCLVGHLILHYFCPFFVPLTKTHFDWPLFCCLCWINGCSPSSVLIPVLGKPLAFHVILISCFSCRSLYILIHMSFYVLIGFWFSKSDLVYCCTQTCLPTTEGTAQESVLSDCATSLNLLPHIFPTSTMIQCWHVLCALIPATLLVLFPTLQRCVLKPK